jgi:hypothetical protein
LFFAVKSNVGVNISLTRIGDSTEAENDNSRRVPPLFTPETG